MPSAHPDKSQIVDDKALTSFDAISSADSSDDDTSHDGLLSYSTRPQPSEAPTLLFARRSSFPRVV